MTIATPAPESTQPIQASAAGQVAAPVFIHGPQGCGKSKHAAALAKHYGKTTIIDDWHVGTPIPAHALALTSMSNIEGAIEFDAAMQAAGLAEESAPGADAELCADIREWGAKKLFTTALPSSEPTYPAPSPDLQA